MSDTPMESARRGHVLSQILLEGLRDYCQSPKVPKDGTKPKTSLLELIDGGLEQLKDTEPLLGTVRTAPVPPALLAAIENAEDVAVRVQIGTFIKEYKNPEVEIMKIRSCISAARPS